jgi:hypothetical protein
MNSEQTGDQKPDSLPELLHLRGVRPLFAEELRTRLAAGARCVRFEFCLSLLFVTVRRQSPVYLTFSWHQRYLRGLGYSALALLLGLWGVPWGLIWTPWAIWVNTTGGADCTHEVLAWLDSGPQAQPNVLNAEVRPV